MHPGRSLALRLVLVIAGFSTVIFAVTLGYNYWRSRLLLERELESNARHLAASLVSRVETRLVAVQKVTEGLARSVATGGQSEDDLLRLLRTTLEGEPDIYGMAVAFEPNAFRPGTRLFAPYYFRGRGAIHLSRLEETYRQVPYLYWDWYQIPRELERVEWSEPYFAEGAGNILLATCGVPFYGEEHGERVLRGIVSASISVDSLTELVSSVRILQTGYAAILSRNGMILAHPMKEAIMNESFFSIAEGRNDPAQRAVGRRMVHGETGFVHYTSLMGFPSYMYYAPVRSTGWSVAALFPEKELFASVDRLTLTMAGIGGAGLLLLLAAVYSIATSVTRPLRSLALATHRVSAGDFDEPLPPIRSRDEVGTLARDFQAMQGSLKKYIADLTATTAAKERIESELELARDIQASLLPRVFPPFPDRPELDIFASMDPAKEVGGDFYDFFFVDQDRLCFLIADVADKGVPAALYMMVVKTLLKTEGQRLGDPDRILASVNDILAADNERCMFASVLCAVLDARNGELRIANAGHNPPLLVDAMGARYLPVKAGLVLGPRAGARYEMERITLQPGDSFFLYTDGVTEARDRRDALYGEAALLEGIRRTGRVAPETMVRAIRTAVRAHAEGVPQSDDVTMLAITYVGGRRAGRDA
ncbi:MAG: SpoIIE family protein phosphatase [Bacteroidota bacterium]